MHGIADMTVFRLGFHAADADARIVRGLRRLLLAGVALVLLLPAARGHNPWLGWMPLWLVGMPLSALWAARGFRLPRRNIAGRSERRRRRRHGPQARRHTARSPVLRLPRVA